MELSNESVEGIGTKRLEMLTDGVFAIAMTLLVLDLRVPELEHGFAPQELWRQLSHMLPNLLSFVLSFVVLGMYWTAHHTEFQYIKRLDHKLIWLNIFYMLAICLIPFSGALLARYYHEQIALVVYSVNMLIATGFHFVMWRHAVRNHRLVEAWIDPRLVRFGSFMSYYSLAGYALAIGVSYISIPVTIAILCIIPIPFILGMFYRIIREELS